MKTKVDQDTCIGCGLCVSTCPEVYEMNDEGKSVAIDEDVAIENKGCAQQAADGCPVNAIEIY